MTDQCGRDYLQQVMRLDPRSDAEKIVAMRAAQLQLVAVKIVPVDLEAASEHRRLWAESLEMLRRDFWATNAEEINRRLDEFDLRSCPEWTPSVRRLRQVAAVRPEVESLAGPADPEREFVNVLRKILVASPSEAGRLRRAGLSALSDLPHSRRDPRVRAAVTLAARIADQHRELFALEEEWLTRILRLHARPGGLRSGVIRVLYASVVPVAIMVLLYLVQVWLLR